MKIQHIECEKISSPKSGKLNRSVNKDPETLLDQSIELEVVHQPIVVRRNPMEPGHFIVVQGSHRLCAMPESLNKSVIECVVLSTKDEAGHETALITGNLWRRPLTRGQQTLAIKKWYEQFALANPTLDGRRLGGYARARSAASARSVASKGKTARKTSKDSSKADHRRARPKGLVAGKLSAVCGVSCRTVERWLRIARALTEKQIAKLDEIDASNGDCERIAALKDPERSKVFDLIASGMDARGALREVQKGKPTTTARKAGV